jgi:hypothetical protein
VIAKEARVIEKQLCALCLWFSLIGLDAREIGFEVVMSGLQSPRGGAPSAWVTKVARRDYFAIESDGKGVLRSGQWAVRTAIGI